MEASVDHAPGTVSRTSSTGPTSQQNSLAAPNGPQLSKGGSISSAHSIASTDNPGDGSNGPALSGDGTLDKFKSRGSEDGQHSEGSSHRRRMSKLFKGRRRRRKSGTQDDLSQLDAAGEVPPLPDTRPLSMDPPFQSEESLGLHKSVASSLLTEDSDAESSPARPGISTHHSHAGYLTLSSPLIASETVDSTASQSAALVDSATSAEVPTPIHAKTLDVAANVRRSPSPVGKLREAFAPTRRSTSPKTGGETDGARPSTSGGGLGALFGGKRPSSRRGSKVLDDNLPLHASPPSIHDGAETQSTPTLPSSAPKRIITQLPATPPNLTEAPTTLVTPPTPTDAKQASPTESTASSKSGAKHGASQSNPNIVTSPSGNMISHRRVRSATNPPSKLSNSITAPLSPTIEEAKTPGGTAFPPQSPGGFFSSVFSAAQNAANTLSSTISNTTTGNKNKNSFPQQNGEDKKTGDAGGEEVIGPENADATTENPGTEKRRLAVETLGSGNLSLAQLGISDSSDPSPMSSAVNLPMQSDQASAKAEDIAAAQAVSAAYAAEKPAIVNNERPRSLTTLSGGTTSPPRHPEVTESPSAIQRQGSIRSRISGGRKRRHRGSSATTGHTIAAAIGASTSTLAPQAVLNGQRLNGTGFAVASPKRNRDFHNLFKSVPEDDYLIEDYSAALQKEILLHGRLYVSEGHLCFSSNILGWVTNLVISFDEVVSVEKKSTAVVFPNAIVIQTLHARNVFASFLSRDSTYDLIIGIWKISHPNLKSSLNGVALDGSGTGDKTEKAESIGSEDGSIQDSDDEVYDEDAEEEEGLGSFTEMADGSVEGSENDSVKVEGRKASAVVAQAVGGGPSKLSDVAEAVVNGSSTAQDFPGATTHGPTECGDSELHYDKLLIDTTIPAPLGKIYSMMWGPASGVFMRKWLVEDQKSSDLQMEDDKKGLGEDRKTITYSYIKPLGGAIGPKQTKCNISATLEQFDLDKAVTVLCSTGTPDVPSGNIFLTKTRYCLMWGPGNSTRLIMTFVVEWSGKSWLKGPIEKGANDGQLTYATSLASALRSAVSAKLLKAPGKPGKPGKRRAKGTPGISDESAITPPTGTTPETAAAAKGSNWGLFEPVRTLLGPVADILESVVSVNVVVGFLVVLLVWSFFFRGSAPRISHGQINITPAQRIAAYEEIWRTEENELWSWLEERVAMDRVHGVAGASSRTGESWGKVQSGHDMQERLGRQSQGMKERQIDEAIRVTEERLRALKSAVRRKREGEMWGTESKNEEGV
ncbi:uncharacterized protein BDR25DRAFT_299343 [Lindgomyces ingoldianus]|uniref:Uncharacterized protein n=1 Tax=Lindgomyces ingoldianus TaxID=673940 RepID=A0ACB6RF37_9PLEO|nr:uncharacterized protein BDR25DRAFT_299343 [Lindgomyces ingoldianus]KAF2477368.1 hypothetical protein BDR25DRAFT_299343 [Lindgomyces ingoldianus]